ncbi:MAG TPA: hypothetical protein VGK93_01185 [Candidatus Eisenbacteria bacterium]|jgi:hypothetical protein
MYGCSQDAREFSDLAPSPEPYDVQGRLVLRQTAVADGSGRDSIRLELTSAQGTLGAGIYFAVVRDAAGVASNPLHLVLLR